MKITKAHKDAGILEIRCQDTNKSWNCMVDLRKVDLQNTQSNPRRHSKQHGNKIKSNWMDECVRNPILLYRSGVLTTIDGRHTSTELLGKGYFVVSANVFFEITTQMGARIFLELTKNSKRIGSWDGHDSGLRSGDLASLSIQESLDNYNLVGKVHGLRNREIDITSYKPLMEAYNASGDRLDKLCYILSEVYRDKITGRVNDIAKNCEFMRGLIDLCGHDDFIDWNPQSLSRQLCKVSIYDLRDRVNLSVSQGTSCRANRSHWFKGFLSIMRTPRGISRKRTAA